MNNLFYYTRKAAIEASTDSQAFVSRAGTRVLSLSAPQKMILALGALALYYALFAAVSWAAAGCGDSSAKELMDFIGYLTRLLSYAIGALALLMFMVGGIMIVVGGTSSRVNQGFKILKNALIGLGVAVAAFAGQAVFVEIVDAGFPGNNSPACVGEGQDAVS
jgi:hypothetical protein